MEMDAIKKGRPLLIMLCCFCSFATLAFGPSQAIPFEPLKGDLSKYDPNNQTFPTSGDTIKIAIWDIFSGVDAYIGEDYYAVLGFVAQDINSQGGIKVDGKMKKIQLFKGDNQGDPNVGKRAMEKLYLEDKVDFVIGCSGTHLSLIAQQVAGKYRGSLSQCCGPVRSAHGWKEF